MSVGNVSNPNGYAYRNLAGPPVQRGTNAPNINQASKPTQATSNESFRVYAGDSIPSNVVLNPNQRKQLFEEGFIDVQRSSTMMESNEGLLSITGKLIGALVGPSKSVAAISIDPKFLEMIKDPNAIVGMGYTRVISENFTILPPVRGPQNEPGTQPEPENTAVNVDISQPALQQTERARNERSLRLEREAVENQQIYMVEKNGAQNDSSVNYMKKGETSRTSDIYSQYTVPREKEIKDLTSHLGMGQNLFWNGDFVLDATWHGAHVEAVLQNREMAVNQQFVERFAGPNLNDAIKATSDAGGDFRKAAVKDGKSWGNESVRSTYIMAEYVNKKLNLQPPIDVNKLMKGDAATKTAFQNAVARAFDFPDYKAVTSISNQAKEFRTIGYVSEANTTENTGNVATMSKTTRGRTIEQNWTGVSRKSDGTRNFYDTIAQLKKATTDKPGYNQYKDAIPGGASSLYDVYKHQTANTAIPQENLDEYVTLYNQVIPGGSISVEQLNAQNVQPTLKDMYALIARQNATNIHAKDKGAVIPQVAGNNGRVSISNEEASLDTILNTRMILEANTGDNQMMLYDRRAIDAINSRAEVNLSGIHMDLKDNAGKSVGISALDRMKIEVEPERIVLESEAHDTALWEQTNGKKLGGGVGYGYIPTGATGGGGTPTVAFDGTEADLRNLATTNEREFRAVMSEAFGITGTALDAEVTKAKDSSSPWQMPEKTTSSGAVLGSVPGNPPTEVVPPSPEEHKAALIPALTSNLTALNTLSNYSDGLNLVGGQAKANALVGQIKADLKALIEIDPNTLVTFKDGKPPVDKTMKASELEKHIDSEAAIIEASIQKFGEAHTVGAAIDALDGDGPAPTSDGSRTSRASAPVGLPTPPALTDDNKGDYYKGVEGYVRDMNTHVNSLTTTGKRYISDQELATMRTSINQLHQNLAKSLNTNPDSLALTTQAEIGKALGIEGAYQQMSPDDKQKVDTAMAAVSFVNRAHANLNLRQDGAGLAKVREAMADLQSNTTNFDLNVTRNQFNGEMKRLAASPEAFSHVMEGAYGLDPSQPQHKTFINELADMARKGKMPEPPNVRFVDPQDLKGGNGAYVAEGGGTILISKELLERQPFDPQVIQDVFAEEMFHHFDHVLNPAGSGNDTDGDEGRGGLHALRAQQSGATADAIRDAGKDGRGQVAQDVSTATSGDHGTVTLNGRSVAAEFNSGNQPYVTAPDEATRYRDANKDGIADATNNAQRYNDADIRVRNAYATGVTHGPDHNQWSTHANMTGPNGTLEGATVAANDGTGRVLNPTQEGRTLQGGEADTMNFTQGAEGDTGGKIKMGLMSAIATLAFPLADNAFKASAAILDVWKNQYTVNLAKDTIVGDVLFDKALNLTVGLRDHQHQERAITEAKLNPLTWSATPDYDAANKLSAARERRATQEAYLDQNKVNASNAQIQNEIKEANKPQSEQQVNPGVAQPKESQNA